jgi:hypothetical protein
MRTDIFWCFAVFEAANRETVELVSVSEAET